MTTIPSNQVSVIITAAGSSTRMGGSVKKEYLKYKNGTVLSCCANVFLKTFISNPQYKISSFVITCPKGGIAESEEAFFLDSEIIELSQKLDISFSFVEGSSTRQASVFNALDFISNKTNCENSKNSIVLIHDGARPFVTEKIILDALNAAFEHGASVPGIVPTDTQKEIDENGMIIRHLVRKNLRAVQTPQCFDFLRLYEAHKKAIQDGIEYTDDTEIWGNYCGAVKVTEGDVNNIKITYPSDLEKLGR